MNQRLKFFGLVLLVTIIASAYFVLYIDDERLMLSTASALTIMKHYVAENYLQSVILYIGSYAILKALCVPGMFLATMVGGALFGLLGLPLTMIGSTTGSMTAFLLVRYFFHDAVKERFPKKIQKLEKQIGEQQIQLVVYLRLIPVIPYYLINLLLPVTTMKAKSFALGTLAGMIPIHTLYTFAGFEIAKIKSTSDILTPEILFTLCLLGVFPFVFNMLKKREPQSIDI